MIRWKQKWRGICSWKITSCYEFLSQLLSSGFQPGVNTPHKERQTDKIRVGQRQPFRQLGFMESLALERVYWSKFGSWIPWLSFDASYKTPFTSVGVGSLGARARYHLMKDEVTKLLHLDFFPDHRCFIWNSWFCSCGVWKPLFRWAGKTSYLTIQVNKIKI